MGYAKEEGKEEQEEGTAKWAPCFFFPGLPGRQLACGWSVSGGMQLREQGGAGVGTEVRSEEKRRKMISRKSWGAWMMGPPPPLQGE